MKIYQLNNALICEDASEKLAFNPGLTTYDIDEANGVVIITEQNRQLKTISARIDDIQDENGVPITGARDIHDALSLLINFKTTGGGSSVGPADAFSIDGIVTDFQYTQSQISNGQGIGNYISYGELFRVDCITKIDSFDIKLNALGTTTTARLFSAIYKFDPVAKIYNLEVACPGEFNVGSAGVVGWNKLQLPIPHTLQPGVYLKISTANENAGSVGYPNHDGLQLTGWIGTGTAQQPYRHLQFVAKFNYYYPAPATIAVSDLVLNTGSGIMKVFNTVTN